MRFSNYSKKLETIEYWYKNPLKSAFVSLLYLDCLRVSSVLNPCSEGWKKNENNIVTIIVIIKMNTWGQVD